MDEEPVSITIIDHPNNVGYPTYWHARDYGLFSANPLGQEVFSKGDEVLNFSLNDGESTTFNHRMLIHSGSVIDPEKIREFTFTEDMYKSYFDGSDLSNWVIKTRRREKKGTIVSEVNNDDNIWWSIVDRNFCVLS